MSTKTKKIFVTLITSGLLLISSLSLAKQADIGIGAIAVNASVIGKGEFVANDTINEGDSLKTGDKGSTTILFNDESMLTLGPKAHASIEVYEETQNGKPGRSIIRVHRGQFRYFPGSILESGGSQFVAVGNKLLGKGIATASVSENNSTPQSAPNSSGNKNENANNSANKNNQDETENAAPADETVISEVEESQEKGHENNDADNGNGNNDNSGNNSGLRPGQLQVAEVGKFGTNNGGDIPGTQQKKHDGKFNPIQLGDQGNQVFAGDNATPTPPAPPSTLPGNQVLAHMAGDSLIASTDGSGSTGVNGLTTSTGGLGSEAFSENGISGNVADGLGNFHGAADVFSRTNVGARTNIGFIGTIKVDSNVALNINARNGLSGLNKTARLPQAGLRTALPTGDLTNSLAPTRPIALVPQFELPTEPLPTFTLTTSISTDVVAPVEPIETEPVVTGGVLQQTTAIFTAQ